MTATNFFLNITTMSLTLIQSEYWLFLPLPQGFFMFPSTSTFSLISCSFVSDSLQPHGLQHTSPPCPSPNPEVYSNSCPLSQWCHPLSATSPDLNLSHQQGLFLFQWVGSSIRWLKYWSFSFSISSSNEYSGLIFFRIDWFDFLAV